MYRTQKFKTISFLIVFATLSFFWYAYIGIISLGGKGYSPFLYKYANFPAWLTYVVCSGAKILLQLAGYDVYQKALNNVTIRGGRGINIIWACLGFKVMSFWFAFIVAHRADWKYKLKWIVIGIAVITGINIIRMDLIALGLHYNWNTFNAIDIHSSFTIVSYIAIFGLLWWFIKRYKRYNIKKQLQIKNEKTYYTFNPTNTIL